MANTLALEAAAESCSVTLQTPDFNETLIVEEARSHSKHFLPLVQSLFDKSGLAPKDLDFIACGNGPGSFTGLRICFGIAQGLAFGLEIPLMTVSSLESMAHFFLKNTDAAPDRLVSILDARMGELYLGEFSVSEESIKPEGAMQLMSIANAEAMLTESIGAKGQQYALLGPGAGLVTLSPLVAGQAALYKSIQPHSASVAEIALRRWFNGEITGSTPVEICYLRNSVSWDKRKRIRERK